MEKRKNIHLLPTDKGQRITKTSKGTLLWCSKSAEDFIETRKGYLGFHLYITSDEEIKEGDWHFKNDKMVTKSHLIDNTCKKIILTTDQDLIANGVQAIDDDFLEWFVQNPSCEEVPIIPKLFGHPYIIWIEGLSFKEEPKQETLEEAIGKRAVEYCKQYEGTDKYNVAMLAIEFGYQLKLEEDEK